MGAFQTLCIPDIQARSWAWVWQDGVGIRVQKPQDMLQLGAQTWISFASVPGRASGLDLVQEQAERQGGHVRVGVLGT